MNVAASTGRWAGRHYEWTCTGCGTVLCSTVAPTAPEDARCLGCRADGELGVVQRTLRELAQENNRLREAIRQRDTLIDQLTRSHNETLAQFAAARAATGST